MISQAYVHVPTSDNGYYVNYHAWQVKELGSTCRGGFDDPPTPGSNKDSFPIPHTVPDTRLRVYFIFFILWIIKWPQSSLWLIYGHKPATKAG